MVLYSPKHGPFIYQTRSQRCGNEVLLHLGLSNFVKSGGLRIGAVRGAGGDMGPDDLRVSSLVVYETLSLDGEFGETKRSGSVPRRARPDEQ